MAKCKKCENSFGIFELKDKICPNCWDKEKPKCQSCNERFESKLLINGYCKSCCRTRKSRQDKELAIKNIILTTESQTNLKIEKRIDIITAECAYGMNIFKDLFTSVRDIVGGRSESLQKTLRNSKETVLTELKKEAYRIGANAVVGVDIDYSEFSGGGKSMLFIVASGTAVIINETE